MAGPQKSLRAGWKGKIPVGMTGMAGPDIPKEDKQAKGGGKGKGKKKGKKAGCK